MKKNTPKVYITTRRGKQYFCWKDGKRVRYQRCRAADATDAEIERRELEKRLRSDEDDPFERHRNRPLTEHLEDYCEAIAADGTGAKHRHMVRQRVLRILNATGMEYIRDLSPSTVKKAVANLRRLPFSKKKLEADQPLLSAQSRNFYLQSIRQFTRWLVVERRMPFNPLVSLKNWSVQTDRRHDRVRIMPDEFAKLIAAAEKSLVEMEQIGGTTRSLLYQIAYTTGLRRGELASLTPASFQLSGSTPTVTVRASHTKNGEEATIRLHDDLVPLLSERLQGMGSTEPLFPGLAWKKTCNMIRRDLKAAGIPYMTEDGRYRDFHALRHSFISSVWEAGATPPVAQRLARHSDIRLTMRYSHVDTKAVDEVIQRLPGLPRRDSNGAA